MLCNLQETPQSFPNPSPTPDAGTTKLQQPKRTLSHCIKIGGLNPWLAPAALATDVHLMPSGAVCSTCCSTSWSWGLVSTLCWDVLGKGCLYNPSRFEKRPLDNFHAYVPVFEIAQHQCARLSSFEITRSLEPVNT